MKEQVLNYLAQKTSFENLDILNTKDIAKHCNISTSAAYSILCQLEKEGLAVNHGAANGDNLAGAWWSVPAKERVFIITYTFKGLSLTQRFTANDKDEALSKFDAFDKSGKRSITSCEEL